MVFRLKGDYMKLSENAKRVYNNEYISKQLAEWHFNEKYRNKYKDTKLWRTFKEKYIKEWTEKILKVEYFYDEELIYQGIDFEER